VDGGAGGRASFWPGSAGGLAPPLGAVVLHDRRWVGLIPLLNQAMIAALEVGELFWAEGRLSSWSGRFDGLLDLPEQLRQFLYPGLRITLLDEEQIAQMMGVFFCKVDPIVKTRKLPCLRYIGSLLDRVWMNQSLGVIGFGDGAPPFRSRPGLAT